MIVAGIGSRKGVTAEEVLAALAQALESHGLTGRKLAALATTAFKREEAAIFSAAERLGLPVIVVETAEDGSRATLTHSTLSQAMAGVASVSEAAALAAVGPDGRLLGPRLAVGRVTCAFAVAESPA